MKMINADTFVVFDLDDTLYKENDYHTSGIHAVADIVKQVYKYDSLQKMLEWKATGVKDILGALCETLSLPMSTKEGFLWIYRLHRPCIALSESIKKVIVLIEEKSAGIAILTDGRSVTQRLKVAALGLENYPLYISEEWNSEKPELRRFKYIQENHIAKSYVYIADNPKKDFKGPNELNWKTIGLRGDEKNVHLQNIDESAEIFRPTIWISKLEELTDFL